MIFVGICMFTCYNNVACDGVSEFGDPLWRRKKKNVVIKLRPESWASLAIEPNDKN